MVKQATKNGLKKWVSKRKISSIQQKNVQKINDDLDFLEAFYSAMLNQPGKMYSEDQLERIMLSLHHVKNEPNSDKVDAYRKFLNGQIEYFEELYHGIDEKSPNYDAEREKLLNLIHILNTFKISFEYREIKAKDRSLSRISHKRAIEKMSKSGENHEPAPDENFKGLLEASPFKKPKRVPFAETIFSFCSRSRRKQISQLKNKLDPLWIEHIKIADKRLSDLRYLDDELKLTEAGKQRFQQLLDGPTQYRKISSDDANRDLFLLANVIGSDLLKRVAKKYGIDLTKHLSGKSLRMLLIGISANYLPTDPIAKIENKEYLNGITALKPHWRSQLAMSKPEEQILAETPGEKKQEVSRKIKRSKKISHRIKDKFKSIFSGAIEKNIHYLKDIKFLDAKKNLSENYPVTFLKSRHLLNGKTEEVPYNAKIDAAVHETTNRIVEMLEAEITRKLGKYQQLPLPELEFEEAKKSALKAIGKEFPSLSKEQLKGKEIILEDYINLLMMNLNLNKSTRDMFDEENLERNKEILFSFIEKQYMARLPFVRAEYIGHSLAYADLYTRDGHSILLPTQDNQFREFSINGVIRDENGLGMAIMSPRSEGESSKVDNEPGVIPLIITFPGTHDLSSAIRDTNAKGAGVDQFDPESKYFIRMMTALNQQIGELKKKHPNKKISIETFGHSLGGADTYNFTLAVLQAMCQNERRRRGIHNVGESDPVYQKTHEQLQKVEAEYNNHGDLVSGLDAVLGLEKRQFGTLGVLGTHKTQLDPSLISNFSLDNIEFVGSMTNNSAGIHDAASHSMHAAAAYLGTLDREDRKAQLKSNPNDNNLNGPFQIKTYTNMTKGDLVQQTAHTRDFAYATRDPTIECFSHVDVNLCEHDIGMQDVISQARKGKSAPLHAHTDYNFKNPDQWMMQKRTLYDNKDRDDQAYQNRLFSNPLRGITGVAFVNNPVYVAPKAATSKGLNVALQGGNILKRGAAQAKKVGVKVKDVIVRPKVLMHNWKSNQNLSTDKKHKFVHPDRHPNRPKPS